MLVVHPFVLPHFRVDSGHLLLLVRLQHRAIRTQVVNHRITGHFKFGPHWIVKMARNPVAPFHFQGFVVELRGCLLSPLVLLLMESRLVNWDFEFNGSAKLFFIYFAGIIASLGIVEKVVDARWFIDPLGGTFGRQNINALEFFRDQLIPRW